MNWKFSGDRPVYQQIMENIRGAVLRGELPPGGKIPSVRDLAAAAQVNPNTMQRAMTELERSGLVYSQRTAGRFVTEDRAMIEQTKKALAECHIKQFLESMDQLGFQRDEVISLLRQETGKEGITDGSSGM